MRPKRQSRPSASTCINTSSRLRSRLVAAILDSRDGMSIQVCVPWYLDLSQSAIVAKCKQSRCTRARNPIRFIIKLRKRKREKKWEKVACFFPRLRTYLLLLLYKTHILHSHSFIKVSKDCACHVFLIVLDRALDFGLLALQQRHVGIATGKEVCSTLPASLDQISNSL